MRRALVMALLLAAPATAACSDDDGRESQAGNVTAPPATIETTTTTSTPEAGPGDGSPAGSAELAGTAWLLAQVVEPGQDPIDANSGPVPAVVTFTAKGVDVYDGVNTVGGEYTAEGGEVRLELGTPSQFPYPDDGLPQYELIDHLGRLERAEVAGERLQLTLTDGTRLTFEQAGGGTTG